MFPLDAAGARYVRTWLGPPAGPGLLALRHALVYRRPGLLGDHATTPKSVVLVREGDSRLDVFGAGAPEPAVTWLANQARGFTLLSPEDWHDPIRKRLGLVEVEDDAIETWSGGFTAPQAKTSGSGIKPNKAGGTKTATSAVVTRRLTAADFAAFTAAAPGWALRGWRAFPALIEYGAAFGVPHGSSFASIAWVFDQVDGYDAVSVYTTPRYRRLGLGRAAALALVEHIVKRRGKIPLWSTSPRNLPGRVLARTLGFSVVATEPLLRWPPTPTALDPISDP
jgi:GNAT superfamily N-acetyltransferase